LRAIDLFGTARYTAESLRLALGEPFLAGDGTDFSVLHSGILWHVGSVRGTIFAVGAQINNGSNSGARAFALRKTNQGGYAVVGAGARIWSERAKARSGAQGGCPAVYSNNGIANINFGDPGSNQVVMLRR
jgi:hypothetical protein